LSAYIGVLVGFQICSFTVCLCAEFPMEFPASKSIYFAVYRAWSPAHVLLTGSVTQADSWHFYATACCLHSVAMLLDWWVSFGLFLIVFSKCVLPALAPFHECVCAGLFTHFSRKPETAARTWNISNFKLCGKINYIMKFIIWIHQLNYKSVPQIILIRLLNYTLVKNVVSFVVVNIPLQLKPCHAIMIIPRILQNMNRYSQV